VIGEVRIINGRSNDIEVYGFGVQMDFIIREIRF
jgi:hypothetical protein